jgi:hypothetical protein
MASQAFLFTAFAICITVHMPRLEHVTRWLYYIIPTVGVFSAFLVGVAIMAAHGVIEKILKPAREKLEVIAVKRGYEKAGVAPDSRYHRVGDWPSKVLPWVLLAIWVLLIGVAVITHAG